MISVLNQQFRYYLHLCLGLLALASMVDLSGYFGYCPPGICEKGSWAVGSTVSVAVFVLPALLIHYLVPSKIKGHLLAILLCFVVWVGWIILQSLLSGEEFKPTIISMVGLYLLYKASSGRSVREKTSATPEQ